MDLVLGADCVVCNATGEVLLIKREDFRFWAIPGGGSEPGESPAETAVRETLEESGIEVTIDDLVGVYTYGSAEHLVFVYTAHPIGGTLRTSLESVDCRYFAPQALPDRMFRPQRQRLLDGLSSARGLYRWQVLPLWAEMAGPALLGLRRLRNRLAGRPEIPPVRRPLIAAGVLQTNGSGPVRIEAAPEAGCPPWDALREQAEALSGQPVEVVRMLDVQSGPGPLRVQFQLRPIA